MDQNFHLIEKYFQGKLDKDELQLFNQRLQKDSAFEQEFRDMKLIRDAVKETSRIKALDILQNAEANLSKKETTKINVSMKRLVSIAASLLIIATVSYFAISNGTGELSGEQVFDSYYEPYTNLNGGVRSGEDIALNTLSARAYNAYDIADYNTSANLFADLLKAEKSAQNYLYSGIANLEAGNFKNARANFSTIINDYSIFENQAKWYLSLTLFKESSFDEAISLTANLAMGESEYKKKASKVLRDLNLSLEEDDVHSGASEGSQLIPPTGSTPDGSEAETMGIRQYQTGFVRSFKDGKRYRFINEEPILDMDEGDLVDFVVLRGKSRKSEMAVVLQNYKK